MSSYERRRRGNALRGVPRGRPDLSVGQRGSGHSAVPKDCVQPDTELEQMQRSSRDEGASKPDRARGGCESPLELCGGSGRPLLINNVRAEVKTGLGKSDRPGLQGGLRKSVVLRKAQPRLLDRKVAALLFWATCPRFIQVAPLAAGSEITDEAIRTWGVAPAAGNHTFHVDGPLLLSGCITDLALASIGAGRPLAIVSPEDRTRGEVVAMGDALLPLGAFPVLAVWSAGGLVGAIATCETVRTTRGLLQPAGPATNAVAEQLPRAGLFLIVRAGDAGFSFLARAHDDTSPHPWTILQGEKCPAGKPLPAL